MSNPFPPPDYIRTESTIPGIEVWMPKPPDEKHQEVVEFRCPQCDASKAYSADDGGLTCSFCGYYEAPQVDLVGKGAEEFEFTVETMERATQGWGAERKELVCGRCDAHTTVPTDSLTHTCPFCHSNQVVQVKAPQDVLRPRFIVPFKMDSEMVRGNTAAWMGSSWMLPANLQRLAHSADFTPIYISAWTFDAKTSASWKAEVAHTKTKTTGFGKNRRTRTYTEWRWESGRANQEFDDLMVNGASNISETLLSRVHRFDLRELVEYSPSYLAGVQAQAYDVSLDDAWQQARQAMRERTKKACKSQATSQRMRNFSMNMNFNEENWRYILLPLYIAVYRYNHKPYQILANGQNGEVTGQRPVDWRRIILAVGGALMPALFLGLVAAFLLASGNESGNLAFFITFFLVALALIFGGIALNQAMKMDDI
ncbi:MAG: hypothetical protein GY796_34740 [Chloroflexi bacterium]|nr:hypothetical protein [Chloroflexota bacterium]